MESNRKNKIAIQKIIFYCEEIERMLNLHNNDFDYFLANVELQYACSMCLIQIGEMTSIISDDYKNNHKEIPWRLIKGARNTYVHDYGEIDLNEFWDTLTVSVPELKEQMGVLLKDFID